MANYREYQMIIKLAPSASRTAKPNTNSSVNCHSLLDASDATVHLSAESALGSVEGCNRIVKEKKKITRTKTGCLCCRRRKKKCDEKKPSCSGCLRNNLQCVYPTQETLNTFTQAASSRKSKKVLKSFDSYAASVALTAMKSPEFVPSSPSQPALSCPNSPHSSDSESPISSPKLKPFSLELPSAVIADSKVPFMSINTINYNSGSLKSFESKSTRHISVKSLLN